MEQDAHSDCASVSSQELNPKQTFSPRSIDEALTWFFLQTHKNWDMAKSSTHLKPSGSTDIWLTVLGSETSLIIYDDGEGQSPENFENTFLSLLRRQ